MKFEDLFQHSFKALKPQTSDIRHQVDFMLPSMPMVEACRADDFEFFQPWIDNGRLSVAQMQRACERYYLGKCKSGKAIFWMIDDMMEPLDAHIGERWISEMLKKREPMLEYWPVEHCLFGLHLLCPAEIISPTEIAALELRSLATEGTQEITERDKSLTDGTDYTDKISQGEKISAISAISVGPNNSRPICVVESEASAVVLSELFPESIWMAYATIGHLTPDLFAPLEGQTVILYPRTDSTLSTYLFFSDLVDQTLRLYDLDLSVDTTLEDYATAEQKEREIDLVDFLLENCATKPFE